MPISKCMELSNEDIVNSLGNRMKEIRLSKGMTQTDVADLCNMDKTSYQRVEKARTSPTLHTVILIARALEVSLLDLFAFLESDRLPDEDWDKGNENHDTEHYIEHEVLITRRLKVFFGVTHDEWNEISNDCFHTSA